MPEFSGTEVAGAIVRALLGVIGPILAIAALALGVAVACAILYLYLSERRSDHRRL